MDPRARRHFERAAESAVEQRALARREASALTPLERVKLGLELAAFFVGRSAAVEQVADRRIPEQAGLHRRWRALQASRR